MDLPVNEILCGDAKEVMSGFPAESINCCISSPPYWALRDYGVAGQLGLEPTFEEYIDKLCSYYDEVKRVLRRDGTCWVNLGDTYNSGASNQQYEEGGMHGGKSGFLGQRKKPSNQLPAKSLCCIPDRFRIEMIKRGWILRNKINWVKPNPMPSSAKDRFTVDFEEVMFFVKNSTTLYWIRPDGKMVDKQPDYKAGIEGLDWQWGIRKKKKVKLSLWQGEDYFFEPQYEPCLTECNAERPRMGQGQNTQYNQKRGEVGRYQRGPKSSNFGFKQDVSNPLGRNKRTTWIIPTQATPDAHFATFPEDLVRPMVKAGCPRYVCKKCGKPRVKIYDVNCVQTRPIPKTSRQDELGKCATDPGRHCSEHHFKGYTDCGCNAGWTPGVVLDPFAARAVPARWRPRKVAIISGLILKSSMSSNSRNRMSKRQKAA